MKRPPRSGSRGGSKRPRPGARRGKPSRNAKAGARSEGRRRPTGRGGARGSPRPRARELTRDAVLDALRGAGRPLRSSSEIQRALGLGREAGRRLRRLLMEVALERIEREPLVQGMFWWKWIPGDWRYDRDFSMRNPEAKEALTAHWVGTDSRADAPALTTPQR